MALEEWALVELRQILPLDDGELKQIIAYVSDLPDTDAVQHLSSLLGDSKQSPEFIASFTKRRADQQAALLKECGSESSHHPSRHQHTRHRLDQPQR